MILVNLFVNKTAFVYYLILLKDSSIKTPNGLFYIFVLLTFYGVPFTCVCITNICTKEVVIMR